MKTSNTRELLFGIATGAIVALLGVAGMHYADISFQHLWDWAFSNLRWSVIPFSAVLAAYAYALRRLGLALREGADNARVSQADHWVDLWTGTFFGIGVIWTAIGMRNALLAGLGGLDAETAAELGAFAILQQLVDGGILLALSTTIVGGIGGYLMRVYKNMRVGSALRRYYAQEWDRRDDELIGILRSIDTRLHARPGEAGEEA